MPVLGLVSGALLCEWFALKPVPRAYLVLCCLWFAAPGFQWPKAFLKARRSRFARLLDRVRSPLALVGPGIFFALWAVDRCAQIEVGIPSGAEGALAVDILVIDPPAIKNGRQKFRVEVERWHSRDSGFSGSQPFVLQASADTLSPVHWQAAGRYRILRARCSAVAPNLNPGAFNYAAYLERRGISGVLSIESSTVIERPRDQSLKTLAVRLSESISEHLKQQALDPACSGFIEAFLLARRDRVAPELLERFSNSGTIHILAVSGLHVGLLYSAVRFVLRSDRVSFLIVRLLVLWSYALLTGFSASVVRASAMVSIAEIIKSTGLKPKPGQALLGSAFLLLMYRPVWIFDLGFQLSYSAVAGLIWLMPRFESLFDTHRLWIRKMGSSAAMSLSAQLACLPWLLPVFGSIPLLFLPANLLAVPLAGLVMYLGLPILIAAQFARIPHFFLAPLEWVYLALEHVAFYGGDPRYAVWSGLQFDRWDASCLALLILMMAGFRPSKMRFWFRAFGVVLLIWIGYRAYRSSRAERAVELVLHQSERFWALSAISADDAFWLGNANSSDFQFSIAPGFEKRGISNPKHIDSEGSAQGPGWSYRDGVLRIHDSYWVLPGAAVSAEQAEKLKWNVVQLKNGRTAQLLQPQRPVVDLADQPFAVWISPEC